MMVAARKPIGFRIPSSDLAPFFAAQEEGVQLGPQFPIHGVRILRAGALYVHNGDDGLRFHQIISSAKMNVFVFPRQSGKISRIIIQGLVDVPFFESSNITFKIFQVPVGDYIPKSWVNLQLGNLLTPVSIPK